jgi:2'-5' RNA ligase
MPTILRKIQLLFPCWLHLMLLLLLSVPRIQSFSSITVYRFRRAASLKTSIRKMTTDPFEPTATNNDDEEEQDLQTTPRNSSLRKKEQLPPRIQKLATLSVCMVPPPEEVEIWEHVTKARTQLQDPGLFRWPPHVNLLYPFINIKPKRIEEGLVDISVLQRLKQATQAVEPFRVTLNRFGTFGGMKRGVLWLYPSSSTSSSDEEEPVHKLYQSLVHEFPECTSNRKEFNPHMTLSHFKNLQDAETAKEEAEQWWPTSSADVSFNLTEIYLLQRKGDDGQFMRVASLGLGVNGTIQVHDPHLPFPDMPTLEEDWVRTERMALKARRNGNRGRRGGAPTTNGEGLVSRGRSRSTDTPEEIAAKRAARKAKRDRLEQQANQGNA